MSTLKRVMVTPYLFEDYDNPAGTYVRAVDVKQLEDNYKDLRLVMSQMTNTIIKMRAALESTQAANRYQFQYSHLPDSQDDIAQAQQDAEQLRIEALKL